MKRAIAFSLILLTGCQASRPAAQSSPLLNDRMMEMAGTTLTALQAKLDVCGNNIANAQTIGFKATRVILEDMPYNDVIAASDDPVSVRVGRGTRVASTYVDMSQGAAIATTRSLDFFIEGPGFFRVRSQDTERPCISYTRAGNFTVSGDSELVLNPNQERIEPNITIPPDATDIQVSSSGRVFVVQPWSSGRQEIGQIQLTRFINPEHLKAIGGGLFVETPASGGPLESEPGMNGLGVIRQGMLEGSNVDLIREQIEVRRTMVHYDACRSACLGQPSLPMALAPLDR